jgi:hypothetical protein
MTGTTLTISNKKTGEDYKHSPDKEHKVYATEIVESTATLRCISTYN